MKLDDKGLSPAQHGLGDMDPEEFRQAAHRVVDRVADYLAGIEGQRVVPDVSPGFLLDELPNVPPDSPVPLEEILADYGRMIEPNITHWQHPGFMAYFTSIASGPGILGEWLATALNSNVMFWANAPASTELEQRVVDWLRQMLGLPNGIEGMFTDTASVSSLLGLVAGRHRVPELKTRERGLSGSPPLRFYCSEEAHMSIEKAAIVIGVGRDGVVRIPSDAEFRMRPDLLKEAIGADRAAGRLPFAVVATLGTTSSTSLDPADAIADVCQAEGLWFQVDAAYAGTAAVDPELRQLFSGWDRADCIVVNPHKWMWTPFDASLLLFRDAELFRDAFSLVPEYLRGSQAAGVRNFNEYGIQLGRRFRALKMWMMIRYFGSEGMATRVREHCRLARGLADRAAAEPGWKLMAPVPLSVVCMRHEPEELAGDEEQLEAHNAAILKRVNATGSFYLSHTKLKDRYVIRVALGNLRADESHVDGCFEALKAAATS